MRTYVLPVDVTRVKKKIINGMYELKQGGYVLTAIVFAYLCYSGLFFLPVELRLMLAAPVVLVLLVMAFHKIIDSSGAEIDFDVHLYYYLRYRFLKTHNWPYRRR